MPSLRQLIQLETLVLILTPTLAWKLTSMPNVVVLIVMFLVSDVLDGSSHARPLKLSYTHSFSAIWITVIAFCMISQHIKLGSYNAFKIWLLGLYSSSQNSPMSLHSCLSYTGFLLLTESSSNYCCSLSKAFRARPHLSFTTSHCFFFRMRY